jgi:hypothetical protein
MLGLLTVVAIHFFLYTFLNIRTEVANEYVYREAWLLPHFPRIFISALVLLATSILLRLRTKRLLATPGLKGLYILTLAVMIWPYLFYDFNFYFNQWHAWDRIGLLVMALIALRYPLMLIPTLMYLNLIDYQFNFPLGGHDFLDKILGYEILAVMGSLFVLLTGLKLYSDRKKKQLEAPPQMIWGAIFVALSAAYYHPGLAKMLLSDSIFSWPLENALVNNLAAMHARGWWQVLSDEGFMRLYHLFEFIQRPGLWFIFLTELGFLLFFFHRKGRIALLVSMLILHLGVFAMNGAFFFIWIVIDLYLLRMLMKESIRFKFGMVVLLSLAIHFAPYIIHVPALGWYEGMMDHRVELVANDSIRLRMDMLSPYTRHFQIASFQQAIDEKTLSPGFIVWDDTYYQAQRLEGPQEAWAYEEKWGQNRYEMEMGKNMRRFLDHRMRNHRDNPLRWLKAPGYWNAHLMSKDPLMEVADIESLHIDYRVEWRQGGGEELIYQRRLYELPRPTGPFDETWDGE